MNCLLEACIKPCKSEWNNLNNDMICRFQRDVRDGIVRFSKRKRLTLTGEREEEDNEKEKELKRCIEQLNQWSALFSVRQITREVEKLWELSTYESPSASVVYHFLKEDYQLGSFKVSSAPKVVDPDRYRGTGRPRLQPRRVVSTFG